MNQSYTHLSPAERDAIAFLHAQGASLRNIAIKVKRTPSTISRELQRNSSAERSIYHALGAQTRAGERQTQAHQRPRLKHSRIRSYVLRHLKQGWSPEQIAGRLSIDHSDLHISHEAIYQFLYDPALRQQDNLVPYLARAHRHRQRKGHRHTHRNLHIPYRTGIEQRPAHILTRRQFGHWESDSVISRQSASALNVLVERKTRFTKITKMTRRSARQTRLALTRALNHLPWSACRTITYDNGPENVDHQLTNDILGCRSFFCTPFHSWERGTNENTIGLIRRVFPKKTNFDLISSRDIAIIQQRLNTRPRKCLSFNSPTEVFQKCCT